MQDTDTDRKLRSATTPDDETTCGRNSQFHLTEEHAMETQQKDWILFETQGISQQCIIKKRKEKGKEMLQRTRIQINMQL
ncbi:uncharacterized protein LOC127565100 isoform X2 [Drosophila albomicans]|uniref:Uncharacterized protein LOC127565100 isoform X2 n=1 Tax=Drosophila albomicans TaxID=7291 RepID=A0A9C6W7R2_DROAB|nr:uncharacterized protein LOC127565100 isoform X2 [Drosophila albomicans]